ncbi:MAG: hypothetical protein DRI48_11350 [Chloroflexi bacterium]|nr:MAG: hypothetical protein DRI48_11350 [Chloroflexota bacterium]
MIILKSRHHSIDKAAPSDSLPKAPPRKRCIRCGASFRGNTLICPACHRAAREIWEKNRRKSDGNLPPGVVRVRK